MRTFSSNFPSIEAIVEAFKGDQSSKRLVFYVLKDTKDAQMIENLGLTCHFIETAHIFCFVAAPNAVNDLLQDLAHYLLQDNLEQRNWALDLMNKICSDLQVQW